MINILKHILFRTVLVIITLHTLIPHPHSEDLTEEKHFKLHKESNSLIGIITLAFHESDDDNLDNLIFVQYESIKKVVNTCKYPTVSILNKKQYIVLNRETKKTVTCNVNNFERALFVKLNGLRGPPLTT